MLISYKDKKKEANYKAKLSTILILKDEIDKTDFKKNYNQNS